MTDLKITELDAVITPVDTDLVPTVQGIGTTPLTKKITWTVIKAFLKTYFDSLYSPNVSDNQKLYRQAIINGNFDVWQRGTSFDAPNDIYTADRFKSNVNADFNVKVLRSTDVPNISSKYSFRAEVMTATGGAGSYNDFRQYIEDFSLFDGKVVTFSLYAKCDAGVTAKMRIEDSVGVSASETTISSTSWTKYTLTTTFNTGITSANIRIRFYRAGITVGNGIYIAQVQLNAGSVALPFMPKSFAEELRDCQRYYEIGGTGAAGTAYSASNASPITARIGVQFKVTKRATPTISIAPSITTITLDDYGVGSPVITTPTVIIDTASITGANIQLTGASSTGNYTQFHTLICREACVAVSAEL